MNYLASFPERLFSKWFSDCFIFSLTDTVFPRWLVVFCSGESQPSGNRFYFLNDIFYAQCDYIVLQFESYLISAFERARIRFLSI